MNSKTLIYILDDDEDVRNSLTDLLESLAFRVQAFANSDEFLVAVLKEKAACALVDLRMPGVSGLELLGILRQRQIIVPIVIITGHGDISEAVQAMKLGACDVLQKPFSQDSLLKSIQLALLQEKKVESSTKRSDEDQRINQRISLLSPREREILDLIVAGLSSIEIAEKLGISSATVNNHRTQIKSKMQAKTVAHLLSLVSPKISA
ncbi:MAG: response regulator transcription factor [Oligoflexales bacterium]|nr:response regulator transcription factor [Oligoflexales bacterium]